MGITKEEQLLVDLGSLGSSQLSLLLQLLEFGSLKRYPMVVTRGMAPCNCSSGTSDVVRVQLLLRSGQGSLAVLLETPIHRVQIAAATGGEIQMSKGSSKCFQ